MKRRRRRRKPCAARLREYCRQMIAFMFTNIGVIGLVLGYTVAGAFMFGSIEGSGEMRRIGNMMKQRDQAASALWNIVHELNVFNETDWKDSVNNALMQYQRRVVKSIRSGWNGQDNFNRTIQWSFPGAFLYSLTVISTIGYGNISPRTDWGKVATIFYAIIGMPLFLLYLSNIGDVLARSFKWFYANCCLCRGCPGIARSRNARLRLQMSAEFERPKETELRRGMSVPLKRRTGAGSSMENLAQREFEKGVSKQQMYCRSISCPANSRSVAYWGNNQASGESESEDFTYVTNDPQTVTVPVTVCVIIMVGYIMFGSMIFRLWEKWDQLDGSYFCFISLSSIGFGDIVPGNSIKINTGEVETSFIVCSVYLMLGMAMIAMCFNLMQEQVLQSFTRMKRGMKRICRCKR